MKFVWQDDLYSATTSSGIYMVYDNNGNEVFNGDLATIGGVVNVYLNRIAQKVLGPGTVDFTTGVTFHPTMCDRFVLKDKFEQQVKSEWYIYAFCGDYTPYLSNPINGKLDPRMKFLWTAYNGSTRNITIEGV